MDCCEVPRPELDDNNDGIGRTTGALCGERDRERERKLKGGRERVQGGAFISRCDLDIRRINGDKEASS